MLLTLPSKLTKTAGHANVDIRYPTADSTYRTMNGGNRSNASSPNVSMQENLMKRVIMRKKNNDDGVKNS